MQHRHSSVAEMQSPFLVLISPDFSVCHYSCLFMPLLSPLFSSLSVHLSLPLPPLTLCLSVLPLTSSTFCSLPLSPIYWFFTAQLPPQISWPLLLQSSLFPLFLMVLVLVHPPQQCTISLMQWRHDFKTCHDTPNLNTDTSSINPLYLYLYLYETVSTSFQFLSAKLIREYHGQYL